MRLSELAAKTDIKIEHSKESIDEVKEYFLTNGKLLQEIEGNKFKLFLANEKNIGMFTVDDEFVGFLQFQKDENINVIEKIFILPEFRNQKIAKIFLYWFKMSLKTPVFVGGAIFKDGQNFVQSIVTDPRFDDDIVGYNIKTKEKFKFDLTKFYDGYGHTGFLIEQFGDFYGMYDNSLPGRPKGSDLICLEMFEHEYEN
jgi:hypothetical protein